MVFDGWAYLTSVRALINDKDKHRGWVHTLCPFCGDRKGHLGCNLVSGTFTCFKCGKHKTLDVIERLSNCSPQEARFIYREHIGASAGFVKREATGIKIDLPPVAGFCRGASRYLEKRFLWDPEILIKYDLRDGGKFGKWAYRVVIPIYFGGKIVSATARDWSGKAEIPYLTLAMHEQIMDMKTIFLGLDQVKDGEVAVVEGPFDAIRGGPGFISSFGAAFTPEQLLLLSTFRRVHLVLDKDSTGQKANERYALELDAMGVDVDIITWHGKSKDTGEFAPESIIELRQELRFTA